jgi:hypothetical protein
MKGEQICICETVVAYLKVQLRLANKQGSKLRQPVFRPRYEAVSMHVASRPRWSHKNSPVTGPCLRISIGWWLAKGERLTGCPRGFIACMPEDRMKRVVVWPAEPSSTPVPAGANRTAGACINCRGTTNWSQTTYQRPFNSSAFHSSSLVNRYSSLPEVVVVTSLTSRHHITANTIHILDVGNILILYYNLHVPSKPSVCIAKSFQKERKKTWREERRETVFFFCGSGRPWPRHVMQGVFITHAREQTLQGTTASRGPQFVMDPTLPFLP